MMTGQFGVEGENTEFTDTRAFTVSGIGRAMWKDKYFVFVVVALFTLVGTAFAILAPPWYQASVLLIPADEKTAEGLSGQLDGLAGLAGLAGIRVGGRSTAEAIGVLKSRELTQAFIEEQGLMPVLFAAKWDERAKKWRSDDSQDWPDLRAGIRYFDQSVRSVREDRVTGLVTLFIEWRDPELAAKWANLLVERVNERMRARALKEAETNVAYLRRELESTDVVTLQRAIGRLLETELQKLMLAKGNEEFAFRVIDAAQVPELRSWPPRTLIVALAVVLGLIAAALFSVLRRPEGGTAASE